MSTAYLITPLSKKIPVDENAHSRGVDAGSYRILEQNLKIEYAIGDFDSMSEKELQGLKKICPVYQYPVMKDETDSELAVLKTFEKYDTVILYGALSGRLDHTVLNISLMIQKYPSIILMDETQKVRVLKKGRYELKKDYKNISFFALEESEISYSGFLYSLDHRKVSISDLYLTSNSLIQEKGIVEIHSGSLLCIQTNEK